MNVFVVSPGRTGTKSFSKACEYISNYTSGHETRIGLPAREKIDYPENHIECDNRLVWLFGPLYEKYADSAVYVKLRRDPEKIAASYNRRWHVKHGVMTAYASGILMASSSKFGLDFCRDYVETVDKNINFFLKNVKRAVEIDLEHPEEGFAKFWEMIGAEGHYSAALETLGHAENASKGGSYYRKLRFQVGVFVDRLEEVAGHVKS